MVAASFTHGIQRSQDVVVRGFRFYMLIMHSCWSALHCNHQQCVSMSCIVLITDWRFKWNLSLFQELEAIKARVREMEEEAEKLKELQNEVEKQMNLSPPPGAFVCLCFGEALIFPPLSVKWSNKGIPQSFPNTMILRFCANLKNNMTQ